jgi:hypothetical protein
LAAYKRLAGVGKVQTRYTEADLPGLGANTLSEPARQEALQGYAFYLERFALDSALRALEANPRLVESAAKDVRKLFGGELLREISRTLPLPGLLVPLVKRWHTLELRWQERIKESAARDAVRGSQIFSDYEATHPEDSGFADWNKRHFEGVRRLCNSVFKSLRHPS